MDHVARTPTVAEYFQRFYQVQHLAGASAHTLTQYEIAIHHWQRFASNLSMEEISGTVIGQFCGSLLPGRSPATVNKIIRHLMAILHAAAEEEVIAKAPRWKKLREPKRVPLALTTEEFSRVLAAASDWPHRICGVIGEAWWTSLLLVAWESGLRVAALLSVRTVDVLWDSSGIVCQAEAQKDREAQWFPMPPYTMEAVRAIYSPDRELLWPRDVTEKTVGRWFRKILDASGVYAPKGCGMCFHRIRRSKASYTKAAGADATKALGHSAPSVTERYFDPRIVGSTTPVYMPTPLLS